MYWAKKRELTPDEVKQLPPETEVHLESQDRHGELTWYEGRIRNGKTGKVFVYYDFSWHQAQKAIKEYPGKRWTIQEDA